MEIQVLSMLVVWRLSHLLSKEDGPFDIIYRFRRWLSEGFFGSLLDCFYCVSVWIAFPFGMWIGNSWWEKLLYWWALSGAACLLEQATTRQDNNDPKKPDYKED